jgi:hypothetical protein
VAAKLAPSMVTPRRLAAGASSPPVVMIRQDQGNGEPADWAVAAGVASSVSMARMRAMIGMRGRGVRPGQVAASSQRACSSSRPVSAVTSWSRVGGLLGAVVLLSAYRGEFPLDVGTDGRISPQGFEASCELVAIEI